MNRLSLLTEKDVVRQVDGLLEEEATTAVDRIKTSPTNRAIKRLAKELSELKADKRAQTALDSISKAEKENTERFEASESSYKAQIASLRKELLDTEKRGATDLLGASKGILARLEKANTSFDLEKEESTRRSGEFGVEVARLKQDLQKVFGDTASIVTELDSLGSRISDSETDQAALWAKSEMQDEEIEKIEKSLLARINSIRVGGGNANRSIIVNGDKDTLGKFTDINLKPGNNVTLTYSANAATGYTDITITASASGGNSRSVNNIAINTAAGSSASTDYVYIASAALTVTLPATVGNTNLYTVKNNSTGNVTIVGTGADTIDNDANIILAVKYTSVDLISDGVSNWSIT